MAVPPKTALAEDAKYLQVYWAEGPLCLGGKTDARYSISRAPGASPIYSEDGSASCYPPNNWWLTVGKAKPLSTVQSFSQQLYLNASVKLGGKYKLVFKNYPLPGAAYSHYSVKAGSATRATIADTANMATTCSNWKNVSCPAGQYLRGFDAAGNPDCAALPTLPAISCPSGRCLTGITAAGTPTCVPCGGSGASTFQLVTQSMNWDAAQANCVTLGGQLATFASEAESLVALNSLPLASVATYADQVHIGARNYGGTWSWVTGEPMMVPIPWNVGEPLGDGSCVSIYIDARKPKWNDLSCNYLAPSICELN